ncbi:hypothetical protein TNCV_2031531 [Trichonephila clavipes]|nr:hypothetical protein TNCV_2031531 [Trichonephila clavipes]
MNNPFERASFPFPSSLKEDARKRITCICQRGDNSRFFTAPSCSAAGMIFHQIVGRVISWQMRMILLPMRKPSPAGHSTSTKKRDRVLMPGTDTC